MASDQAELWKVATDEEVASLHKNGTWDLVELPPGVKPIDAKWVLKIKCDAKGNVERYKARLVAKGFMQREGIDFNDVYAPTVKHATLRALLALVNLEGLALRQLDVKTAFLNGDLEEEVYMKQPEGYEEGGPNLVCKLRKALYGLKQAPREWHKRLKTELEKIGFVPSEADPGLYIKQHEEGIIFLLVYVDDILLASATDTIIDSVVVAVGKAFDIRDLGEPGYFLGMELERDRAAGYLKLTQTRMTKELVKKFNLQDANPKVVPLSPAVKLSKTGEELDKSKNGYSELVGSLLYLSVCTRPDIAQAVGALARYMSKPTEEHWAAAKGVLRYLKGTLGQGVVYDKNKGEDLDGYCDADYAGDVDSRRSTTGYVFNFGGGVISWSSRLQPTVAASTTEAEYMAAASAVREALWLRKLMPDLGIPLSTIKINCDSQSALALLKDPVTSQRSKHIDVLYHFARERVARKEVVFSYIKTADNVADIMTKALPEAKFKFCKEGMGIGG